MPVINDDSMVSNFDVLGIDINSDTIYDAVNNPRHYTQGNIECIDAIKSSMSKEAFKGFLKGNAIKYLWRYEKKENPIEDLKKCQWYLNKLIENN